MRHDIIKLLELLKAASMVYEGHTPRARSVARDELHRALCPPVRDYSSRKHFSGRNIVAGRVMPSRSAH